MSGAAPFGAAVEPDPFAGALGFVRLLWQVNHHLQAASKRMGKELGVTGPQRLVVRAIGASPGMSPGQLAQLLFLDPGTITGVVARLQRAGFVRRASDPHDGRRSLLALTQKGRKLASRNEGSVEERVERALAQLLPEEAASARRALGTLVSTLEVEPGGRVAGQGKVRSRPPSRLRSRRAATPAGRG